MLQHEQLLTSKASVGLPFIWYTSWDKFYALSQTLLFIWKAESNLFLRLRINFFNILKSIRKYENLSFLNACAVVGRRSTLSYVVFLTVDIFLNIKIGVAYCQM